MRGEGSGKLCTVVEILTQEAVVSQHFIIVAGSKKYKIQQIYSKFKSNVQLKSPVEKRPK